VQCEILKENLDVKRECVVYLCFCRSHGGGCTEDMFRKLFLERKMLRGVAGIVGAKRAITDGRRTGTLNALTWFVRAARLRGERGRESQKLRGLRCS